MPTYEYVCTDCGHDLEAVQSFSDAPLTTCPQCGGALRKVFSSVGFVLKGSGFYKTDNRRPSKGKGGTSDGGSSSDSSSDGAKAADSGGSGSNGTTSGKSEKTEKSDKSPSNGSGSSGAGSDSGSSKPSKSKASTT
jgi:putative FmdB family regulatory protein